MPPVAKNLRVGQRKLSKTLNLVGRSGYAQNAKGKMLNAKRWVVTLVHMTNDKAPKYKCCGLRLELQPISPSNLYTPAFCNSFNKIQ